MAAPLSSPLLEVGDYVFNCTRRLGCSQLVEVVQKSTGKLHCGKLVATEKLPEFLQQEGLVYQVLRAHPHPNIQLPVAVVQGPEFCGVIFPPLGEDLHTHVRRSATGLQEREARRLFKTMVAVVAHMHAHRIVARDLRLGKFFFSSATRGLVVFADFESAQVVSHAEPFLSDRKGCPAFVGPEVVVAPMYDGAAADVWSLGVILYLLLVGLYPFHDPSPAVLFQKIQLGHSAVAFPVSMSESARDVICSLLTKEPHLRPTAATLATDLWLASSAPAPTVALAAPAIARAAIPGAPGHVSAFASLSSSSSTTAAAGVARGHLPTSASAPSAAPASAAPAPAAPAPAAPAPAAPAPAAPAPAPAAPSLLSASSSPSASPTPATRVNKRTATDANADASSSAPTADATTAAESSAAKRGRTASVPAEDSEPTSILG